MPRKRPAPKLIWPQAGQARQGCRCVREHEDTLAGIEAATGHQYTHKARNGVPVLFTGDYFLDR